MPITQLVTNKTASRIVITNKPRTTIKHTTYCAAIINRTRTGPCGNCTTRTASTNATIAKHRNAASKTFPMWRRTLQQFILKAARRRTENNTSRTNSLPDSIKPSEKVIFPTSPYKPIEPATIPESRTPIPIAARTTGNQGPPLPSGETDFERSVVGLNVFCSSVRWFAFGWVQYMDVTKMYLFLVFSFLHYFYF